MSLDPEKVKREIEERIANLMNCFTANIASGKYVLDIPEAWEDALKQMAMGVTPDWLDWAVGTIVGIFIDIGERAFGTLLGCISPTLLNAINSILQGKGVSPIRIMELTPGVCAKPGSEVELRVKVKNVLEEASVSGSICYAVEEGEPRCTKAILPAGGERELIIKARVGMAVGTYPVKVYVTDEAGGLLAQATVAAIVPDMEYMCSDVVRETAEEIARKIASQTVNLQQLLPLMVLASVLK